MSRCEKAKRLGWDATFGPVEGVKCPSCGSEMNLEDALADDVLHGGWKSECDDCDEPFVVQSVDFEVTVWLRRPYPEEERDGE